MNQKVYGVLILIMCVLIVALAAQGTTPEEQDITVVLILLPLGIYAIFGKQRVLYIPRVDADEKKAPPARRQPQPAAGVNKG